jgi:hypothetical protein
MSIPSRQIGWSQESNLLWYILSQLKRLASVIYAMKPKYKVFTALLSEYSGNEELFLNTGTLGIGVTYTINTESTEMDFTNVGAPNNNVGTSFIATGEIPNSWGGNEGSTDILVYYTGAPIAIVLENTIGNIWFSYKNIGTYDINSDGLFKELKTTAIMATPYSESGPADPGFYSTAYSSTEIIRMYTMTRKPDLSDDYLKNTFIEIRVYN